MNTIKEVLRLTYLSKLSSRQVGLLTNTSQSTVLEYCSRFNKTTASIEELIEYDNTRVVSLLYPEMVPSRKTTTRPHPDWNYVHAELKQKGMTRQLLLGGVRPSVATKCPWGIKSSTLMVTAILSSKSITIASSRPSIPL